MYVCMYICMYAWHKYIYIYMYVFICIHYIEMCIYMRIAEYTPLAPMNNGYSSSNWPKYVHKYTYIYIHTYVCIYIYIYIYIDIYLFICLYKCTYMCTGGYTPLGTMSNGYSSLNWPKYVYTSMNKCAYKSYDV
jgi:hypothetical protein